MSHYVTEYLNARHALIGGPVDKLRTWRRTRRALRELGALDPRLLADIGLDHSTIRPLVDGLITRIPARTDAANDNAASSAG